MTRRSAQARTQAMAKPRREGGAEGIHEYLQTKYTLTPNPFG